VRRCTQCNVDYPDVFDVCPDDGTALPPSADGPSQDPLIGTTIDGRYQVEAVLGEGGMGLVYACRHAIIDKRVAVKVLRREAAQDESAAQRFLAEAKAASKIGQQNIVDITDFGVLPGGAPYFVMEFLDGPTLGRLTAAGAMSPARAVSIAIQVARGLSASHAKGIVHRDLKPDNIFVLLREGMPDFVKVVDFGIARDATVKKRLTVAGTVMGTPEYMAPEQASGQDIDHRVDQYALGCILYETLTGRVPFRGENPMQTLTMHVYERVVAPSKRRADLQIPEALEAVVMRALAKDRNERYANLDEMMRALQAIQPQLPNDPVPPTTSDLSYSPTLDSASLMPAARRAKPGWLLPVLVVCALALVGTFALTRAHSTPEPTATVVVPDLATPATPNAADIVAPPRPRVQVTIRSIPAGARVFLGDEDLGLTPVTTEQPVSIEAPLRFILRKPGFRDATRDVEAKKDSDVEVALVHEPTPPKRATPTPAVPRPIAAKPPAGETKNSATTNNELRNPF
jgi:serine/threonine-protein kinase